MGRAARTGGGLDQGEGRHRGPVFGPARVRPRGLRPGGFPVGPVRPPPGPAGPRPPHRGRGPGPRVAPREVLVRTPGGAPRHRDPHPAPGEGVPHRGDPHQQGRHGLPDAPGAPGGPAPVPRGSRGFVLQWAPARVRLPSRSRAPLIQTTMKLGILSRGPRLYSTTRLLVATLLRGLDESISSVSAFVEQHGLSQSGLHSFFFLLQQGLSYSGPQASFSFLQQGLSSSESLVDASFFSQHSFFDPSLHSFFSLQAITVMLMIAVRLNTLIKFFISIIISYEISEISKH